MLLYHINTKTAIPLYQNCGLCLAERVVRKLNVASPHLMIWNCLMQNSNLNLTPREPQSSGLWHFVPCCAVRNARGAIGARLACASTDTLALDYLRRRLRSKRRRKRGKSLLLRRQKQKQPPNGGCFCLAQKERFELSRRISPAYILSRDASSAT